MTFQSKSIEELLDLETEVRHQLPDKQMDSDHYSSYDERISLYRELYRKIKHDRKNEYVESLPYIKEQLISYLIDYGTYLKTEYRKDDNTALHSLREALRYDKEIPMAHYRLGFLYYKKKTFLQAQDHFHQAATYHKKNDSHKYLLTSQQIYNTQLYLSNSALYIAEGAQRTLETLETKADKDRAPRLEMSPLYEMIEQNERYLEANAFKWIQSGEENYCTKERCDDIAFGQEYQNYLILYFSDRTNVLSFKGRSLDLNRDRAGILRYLLLHSSEKNPAMKNNFSAIIRSGENGTIRNNTYTQNIRRLKRQMMEGGIPASIIGGDTYDGQPIYYYTHSIPYIVMYRADSTLDR